MLLLLLAVGCASTPEMPSAHDWQDVRLSAEEQKGDPLPNARTLIEQRETPGTLDHAIALLVWHLERHPESADLHQLLAEAFAILRSLDSKRPRKGGLSLSPDEGMAHARRR